MNIKLVVALGVAMFNSSCSKEDIPPQFIEAERIIKEFSLSQKNNGNRPFGTGGSFYKGIDRFSLNYIHLANVMDINDARVLLVNTLESFLELVNSDEKARPYILNYPYDQNQIYFAISFKNDFEFFLKPPNIGIVTCYNGTVSYGEHGDGFKTIFQEPYAVAYEIVKGYPLPENRFDVQER